MSDWHTFKTSFAQQCINAETAMSEIKHTDDLLDMDWINSLPQPFFAGDRSRDKRYWWPVNDFEVQTGLYRIDVCGLLQVCSIGDHFVFMDGNGTEHSYEDFFVDSDRAVNARATGSQS